MVDQKQKFIYTFSCHEDEISLCQLEMRSLFGFHTGTNILESSVQINPSRSPFIKERIDIIYKADCLDELVQKVSGYQAEKTFKVIVIEHSQATDLQKIGFEQRRKIEREIGLQLSGQVDLQNPDQLFAVIKVKDHWVFGRYTKSESIWLFHQKKPNNYSTALSTRVARAVVNIAVPTIADKKVIDPCCGAGTVIIEALSMGIDIVGSDLNPLVTRPARENIAHFGYKAKVLLRDIRDVTERYNVAIIDMPYNLCSVLEPETQLEMLKSARGFAGKVVVITTETIDALIERAGFTITDRCVAKKGSFSRQILVCC
ncbi:TRM11 family SAM-dependent methyltransferase [Metabacillus halosaccharovorans]|uniref:RsmD family RNA methyltransferase n=1 Tax=Metabacillus halosaccharovorans TaxID=930124 RepID=A0ABT3DNS8_9BACI|nr:RsmD family RNA methyltransferase [Metabacillus halosaccharovorans]MCV9888252.1 RsmD family RNA methyltransferase [Metabacillus halosaccharovorans]